METDPPESPTLKSQSTRFLGWGTRQWGQLENPYADLGAMVQKTHPGTNMDEFFAHTTKAREIVRTEMWELIDQAE